MLLVGLNGFGQGLGIENEFYSSEVPTLKGWDNIKAFWKGEIVKLEQEIQKKGNKPELIYKLTIAKYNSGEQDLMSLIKALDKAISLNSKKSNYYAVRGIIKYSWGAYSPSYDIGEGCPDIKKSIRMGLANNLKNSESIKGVLSHPSCK